MKKWIHQRSILLTLFLPFSLLFLIAFSVFIIFYSVTESSRVKQETFHSMQNNVLMISDSLDVEVNKLDTVSQNIIYSTLIREKFTEYIHYTDTLEKFEATRIHSQNELLDLLISMIGPNTPVNQVYLYSLISGGVGVGLDNRHVDGTVRDKDWYEAVIQKSGAKILYCGTDDFLSKFSSEGDGRQYISLCRLYYDSSNVPQGIVEIKKPFDSVNDIIQNYRTSYLESIYIYDTQGEIVYPVSEKQNSYFSIILQNREIENSPMVIEENDEYILYETSDYTGFTIATVIKKKELLQPIYNYLQTNLGLLFFITISIVILSYLIARIISKPLNRIYTNIKGFDITDNQEKEYLEVDTHITELNALYDAFLKMQKKTRESMNRVLTLQNREMQSKMLALQAQMNPHFLYNSLATIQAMSEEGMSDHVVKMCQSMSRILRYISSGKEQFVTVREELEYTEDFLSCMIARFDDDLNYEIQIPETMYEIKIPKLCLQLIVENSIKFVTNAKMPPWYIKISGYETVTHWEISVQDNGPGFSEEQLIQLQDKIDLINESGVLPNLELHGMGLMNIYIRLKLLYRENHIFRINNTHPSGAIVTIGGIKTNE